MNLAVSTAKVDVVNLQLLSSPGLRLADISVAPTNECSITLLDVDESSISNLSSKCDVEALFLEESVATEPLQLKTASESPSFKSQDGADAVDHWASQPSTLYTENC